MNSKSPFKWRHYQSKIILRCVRWYLSYPLSYRQVAEMVNEREMEVHYTTVFLWAQEYSPEIDKRFRLHLRTTNDSWRVDETYIKVKGKSKYLYRAIDLAGNTLEFLLTAKRDAKAAKRFFCKMLRAIPTSTPRVITVDKNPPYPKAIKELIAAKKLSGRCIIKGWNVLDATQPRSLKTVTVAANKTTTVKAVGGSLSKPTHPKATRITSNGSA